MFLDATSAKTGQGVLAEYALVPKQHLRRKPSNLDFDKAAAVPLATLTALSALVDTAGVKNGASAGKKIFIVRLFVVFATAHTTDIFCVRAERRIERSRNECRCRERSFIPSIASAPCKSSDALLSPDCRCLRLPSRDDML